MRTKRVYKYKIERDNRGRTVLVMPEGAEILTFQKQHNAPCIWALVNPNARKVTRDFILIGTGANIDVPDDLDLTYIGTIQECEGHLVWHLFEVEL